MPKPKTAPKITRDHFEGVEVAIYVTPRNPYSGSRQEPFGLLAISDVPEDEGCEAAGELHQELLEQGTGVPLALRAREKGFPRSFDGSEVTEI